MKVIEIICSLYFIGFLWVLGEKVETHILEATDLNGINSGSVTAGYEVLGRLAVGGAGFIGEVVIFIALSILFFQMIIFIIQAIISFWLYKKNTELLQTAFTYRYIRADAIMKLVFKSFSTILITWILFSEGFNISVCLVLIWCIVQLGMNIAQLCSTEKGI